VPLKKFLFFNMGVPEADAEELALDVLLTVHGSVGTFRRGKAKLTTWIFQIAKNRAIDFHRRFDSGLEELTKTLPDSRNRQYEYAGRNQELMDWLQKELQELSPEDRELLLWRAQDISYAEIARWHRITEGAARVRHIRAMEKISIKAKDLETRKGAAQP
jgi:RNA polymerase sigma-70 factor (ECF subfamily)